LRRSNGKKADSVKLLKRADEISFAVRLYGGVAAIREGDRVLGGRIRLIVFTSSLS